MGCYWFYAAQFYKFIDLLQKNYICNYVMLSKFKVTIQVVRIWHHVDWNLRNVLHVYKGPVYKASYSRRLEST